MEESKEIQGTYSIFRTTIYVSLLLEFFMYALDPAALSRLGGSLYVPVPPLFKDGNTYACHHHLHRNKEQETDRV